MKIKVECTLEVDPKVIKQLMQETVMHNSDKNIQHFVRAHVISSGVGVLSEALYDANLADCIDVIKTNVLGE